MGENIISRIPPLYLLFSRTSSRINKDTGGPLVAFTAYDFRVHDYNHYIERDGMDKEFSKFYPVSYIIAYNNDDQLDIIRYDGKQDYYYIPVFDITRAQIINPSDISINIKFIIAKIMNTGTLPSYSKYIVQDFENRVVPSIILKMRTPRGFNMLKRKSHIMLWREAARNEYLNKTI